MTACQARVVRRKIADGGFYSREVSQADDAKYARALALCFYSKGDAEGAIEVLRKAMGNKELTPQAREELENEMRSLEIAEPDKKTP
jgi:hypothetical protein